MAELIINGEPAIAEEGARLLDFLHTRGIEIPTLCYDQELGHFSSCMICAVLDKTSGRMIPSCAARITDGMQIETDSDEVRAFRQTCLELLLSEHLGDCEGPCRIGCPAHMDIPRMIRQIQCGDMKGAIATIKAHIALPAVLGRICSAPCEKVCRRGQAPKRSVPDPDTPMPKNLAHTRSHAQSTNGKSLSVCSTSQSSEVPLGRKQSSLLSKQSLPASLLRENSSPVSICLLKRFAADTDLAEPSPYTPEIKSIGKKAAVIGAGPAGLSAAYYLARLGCDVTVYDKGEIPGGSLCDVPAGQLPPEVLKAEISHLKALGITFTMQTTAVPARITTDYEAVVLATGTDSPALTERPAHVFAAGSCLKKMKMAIRACADGRRAAYEAFEFLTGEIRPEAQHRFNIRMGKLPEEALKVFLSRAADADRQEPSGTGFISEEAVKECGRCLNCDCRKSNDCRLRDYAGTYEAHASRFKGERGDTVRFFANEAVVFEPGKCIRCGLCVRITEAAEEEFGLSFKGRGFGTVIAVPFNEPMNKALQKTAERCIQACPTGALAHPLNRGLQVDKSTSSQVKKPEGNPE